MTPTDHHRMPKRLGGQKNPQNISIVTHRDHDAWNILFDRKNPATTIQGYMAEVAGRLATYVNVFMIGPNDRLTWYTDTKAEDAWEVLFGNMTLDQIIHTINHDWIPCEFRLELEGQVVIRVKATTS